jgi:diguanylate cyclase
VLRQDVKGTAQGLRASDAQRTAAFERLGILDSPPDPRCDRLVELASTVLGMPIALITLLDTDRQWFRANVGLEITETDREAAFCTYAIAEASSGPMMIDDALLDERFANNPLVVDDPRIRFYAGQTIHDSDGVPLGTLCVLDRQPRHLDDGQLKTLGHLATLVEEELARHDQRDLLVELEIKESQKALILDTMSEGLVLQESNGRIIEWNPAAERLLGLSADELSGRSSTDSQWTAIHADGTPWPIETLPAMEVLRTGEPVTNAVMGVHRPNASQVWLRVNAGPILNNEGAIAGTLCTFSDITDETNLLKTLSRYQYLFEHANDLILIVSDSNQMLFASPSLHRLFGTNPNDEDFIASLRLRIHPDDYTLVSGYVDGLQDGTSDGSPLTVRLADRNDEWRHLEIIGVSLLNEPNVAGIVLTARDMTEREEAAKHLAHKATHDTLTELPNRALFETELAAALERAHSDSHLLALCYIDLDNFKDINDTFGHDAGDELLRGVAGVLLANIRAWDTPARIGGDEFVILLDPVRGPGDALALAHRIRQRVIDLGATFNVAFGASIGIAFNRPGDTPASLVRRSDQALYLAKSTPELAVRLDFEL